MIMLKHGVTVVLLVMAIGFVMTQFEFFHPLDEQAETETDTIELADRKPLEEGAEAAELRNLKALESEQETSNLADAPETAAKASIEIPPASATAESPALDTPAWQEQAVDAERESAVISPNLGSINEMADEASLEYAMLVDEGVTEAVPETTLGEAGLEDGLGSQAASTYAAAINEEGAVQEQAGNAEHESEVISANLGSIDEMADEASLEYAILVDEGLSEAVPETMVGETGSEDNLGSEATSTYAAAINEEGTVQEPEVNAERESALVSANLGSINETADEASLEDATPVDEGVTEAAPETTLGEAGPEDGLGSQAALPYAAAVNEEAAVAESGDWSPDQLLEQIQGQRDVPQAEELIDADIAKDIRKAAQREEKRSTRDPYLSGILEEAAGLTVTAVPEQKGVGVIRNVPTDFAETFYTVEEGESLSEIAIKTYGNPDFYLRIYEANRDILSDPNTVFPGQQLRIPSL